MKKSSKVSVHSDGGPVFLDKVDNSGVIKGRSDIKQVSSTPGRIKQNKRGSISRWRTEKVTLPLVLGIISFLGAICAALIGVLANFIDIGK